MKFGMRVRGGLLAALVMFAVPVAASLAAVLVPFSAYAQTVNSIEVVGNRRVDAAPAITLAMFIEIVPPGRGLDARDLAPVLAENDRDRTLAIMRPPNPTTDAVRPKMVDIACDS